MALGIILFLVVLIIFGSLAGGVIMWLYRHLGGQAKQIDWNAEVTYPKYFTPAIILFLLGYHIGLYSYIFVAVSDMRFPATGWAIFSIFAAAAWLILLWNKRSLLVYSAITVIVVSGFMVSIRANGFVQSFDLVVQTVSAFILSLILIRDQITWSLSSIFRSIITTLPHGIIHAVQIGRSLFRRDSGKKHALGGWIKTFVITIAILIVFIYILSQADPIFSQIIKEFRTQLLGRTLASIIILFIAATIASIKLEGKSEDSGSWLSFRDIISAVVAVVAILFIFLFVQYKYLFLGNRDLLVELNLTFSEYVRKGFTELLLATFIGGFLSYIATLKVRGQTDQKHIQWATMLNMILIIELFFLLGSALKRDLLYVDTYGLTRVRVVGGLFLIWLFSFLILLAFFAIKKSLRESRVLSFMWILSIGVWIFLNVINIDKVVIAGAPKHHQYTDYFYLMQLSEDVTEEKTALLPQIQNETEALIAKDNLTDVEKAQLAGIKLALITFIEKRDRLYRYYGETDWLLKYGWAIGNQFDNVSGFAFDNITDSIYATNWKDPQHSHVLDESFLKQRKFAYFNKSEYDGYVHLTTHYRAYFDSVADLVQKIRKFQIEKQISLFKNEHLLLNEFSYPFLNVGLRRYSPEELNRVYMNGYTQVNATVRILNNLESQQPVQIQTLQTPQCSQFTSVEVYGILSNYESNMTRGVQTSQIASISAPAAGYISVQIPDTLKIDHIINNSEENTYVQNGSMSMPAPAIKVNNYYSLSDRFPVKATLHPVSIVGNSCVFEAERIVEILGF